MANQEPNTVTEDAVKAPERKVSGEVINPRSIVFPFDQHGFTTVLRKEGVRAVGRIKGDEEKLKVLIGTLRALGEHAKTKLADQQESAKRKAAAVANRVEADYARSLADQKAEAKRLRAMADSAAAAVEAKEAMPGAKKASK